jgi:hypothetical protein
MKKALGTIAIGALLTLVPTDAFAWGWAAHRLIMRRAIDLLPPELKPFFEHHRDEIVVRSVDPDQWRLVGWDESQNHFLDYGVPEYGPPPFNELPRDYSAALEKFGIDTLKRNGLLPWRAAELFGQMRRSFQELPQDALFTVSNLVLYASVGSHYVQDAFQPLHATDNYDGRATGNDGIHNRFEMSLIERYETRLRLSPAAAAAMRNPRDAMFDALLVSYRLTDPVLAADREALGAGDRYDDAYFERFFTRVQPILEQQLSGAISATAGFIMGAWEEAGKPKLRLTDVRPEQRRRGARP